MKIWIGNDHGGYELKQHVLEYLRGRNIEYHDVGSHSTEISRYPYYAAMVAKAVATNEADRGILIDSTGVGMGIAANKYKGIRASVCHGAVMTRMTRAHTDSNILCLGGKVTGVFDALEMLQIWLDTEYEGGRHEISLGILEDIQRDMISDTPWENHAPMK